MQGTSHILTVYVVEGLSIAEPFDKIIDLRLDDRGDGGCIGSCRRSQGSRPHFPSCGIDEQVGTRARESFDGGSKILGREVYRG